MTRAQVWWAIALISVVTPLGMGGLQEGTAQPEDVAPGDQSISVEQQIDDDRVAARIEDVLLAMDRFSSVRVESRDGVVFLAGEARDRESRDLATDIAQRTQGAVAVVNNMTLSKAPIWTIEPAKQELVEIGRAAVAAAPLVAIGAVVLAVSVAVAGVVSRFAARVLGKTSSSDLVRGVIQKIAFLLIVLVGVYMTLRITGLTRAAVTIAGGTGLVGLALGFAFRDIAENFLASLLLSVQRPFRLGDVIEVDGHTGVVRKVTSRGTLLIDFDGNHIQIANATVYKNTIKNFSANPLMRTEFSIGIGYDDDVSRAQEIVRERLETHPAVCDEPEPLILVEQLGSSTVNLRVYLWVDGSTHSVLKVKSSAIRRVVNALSHAGVSMPDEAREIIFPQGIPVHMSDDTPAPALPAPRLNDELVTEAEGDLSPETVELERQAETARDPEEGANVLAN